MLGAEPTEGLPYLPAAPNPFQQQDLGAGWQGLRAPGVPQGGLLGLSAAQE